MKAKTMLAMLICVVLFFGCGGRKRVCDYTVNAEYGAVNVVKVNSFTYLVRTESQVKIIFKTNLNNPETTRTIDVTEFVKADAHNRKTRALERE